MRRTMRASWAALLALHLTASLALAGLRDDVTRLIRSSSLSGATIAVSVRDAETGTKLVGVNDARPMTPASNMKLFTTGAGLHALGADFQFRTKLLRNGDQLIVVGDGDPAFADPDLLTQMTGADGSPIDLESFLQLWVHPAASSMKRIREIVVDDRVFDREFIHPAWPADQLNATYCAEVAGFNFHFNVLRFYPKPRPGQPPAINETKPAAPWLKVANAGTSRVSAKDKNDAWVARKLNTNEMTMRGNVRFPYTTSFVPVTLHNMPEFFGELLAQRLQAAGVEVGGRRAATMNDPAPAGEVVGPIVTTPISTIIARCNRDSENLYAEALLKRIAFALTGEPGSWLKGGALVRHIIIERLGDPALAAGVIVADGSGLSQSNKITAAAMTAWLNSFHQDEELSRPFLDSLAVAGESGTLKKRYQSATLHGATVQAKTGYINGVSCLSGYITMPDGRRRSFSVLVNDLPPGTVSGAKALQDQIVQAIAEDMASAAGVTLGSD